MTWLVGRIAGAVSLEGSILCFHGLRDAEDRTAGVLHLSVARLNELLAVVRGAGTIVPLGELLGRWVAGKSTRGLLAITFDDAYASLLDTAELWYARAPFPVTVFVVGQASQSGAAFWWDRLDALTPVLLPEEWRRLAESAGLEVPRGADGGNGVAMAQTVRDWVVRARQGRAPEPFQEQLARLEAAHGTSARQRPMTVTELHRFGALGPVTFGPHTMTHPALSTLAPKEVVAEIRTGWEAMSAWGLPQVIPVLAAPYGALHPELAALAAEAGMHAVLALDDRRVGRLRTPRSSAVASRLSMVQGVTAGRLAYRLSGLRELVSAPVEGGAAR